MPSPDLHHLDASSALVAARDGVVVCDVNAFALLAIGGTDAATFLQGQLSNDVAGLAPDGWQYTSYNSPKGRVLANFPLWREGDGFRALVAHDIAEATRRRLAMYVLRSKVTLADASAATVRLGIGGPGATACMRAALSVAPPPRRVDRIGETTVLGLPGPRYLVVAAEAAAAATREALTRHATAAPFAVWEWLTIHAGVPIVTAATQDQFIAQTANLDALGALDFKKGCYTGQEIIARTQYLGRQKERLQMFHAPRADVAAGARLYSKAFDAQPCGTVVNAAPAPEGGADLLAVVQIAAVDSGDVRVGATDGPALSPLPLPHAVPPLAAARGPGSASSP
jgi:folate-binding protein YgfZ